MLLVVFAVFAIQSVCFHLGFVFRDGMDGTPRDTCIEKSEATESLAGMYTSADNARTITELCEYIANDTTVSSAIYLGDCPGLAYILRLKPAISTTWPDLESYSLKWFEDDLNAISTSGEEPIVIVCKVSVNDGDSLGEKNSKLDLFLSENSYNTAFENEKYIVYRR